jgi:hypothetical protein
MSAWKRLCVPLFAALALALVVACGGDDDEPSVTQQPGVSATATQDAGDDGGDEETDAPDDTGNASGEAIDACALLTDDEVFAVVGETAPGDLTIDEDTSACFWTRVDPETRVTTEVELIVIAGIFDSDFMIDGEPVEGLGNEAVWSEGAGIVDALVDNYSVQVFYTPVMGEDNEDYKNTTIGLMEKVLDRLP